MSRHQEIFDEISRVLETEEYEPEQFQEMCYGLAEEIDELREVIRACAAGPWRTDVENAPKDGSEVIGGWYETDGEFYHNRYHWDPRPLNGAWRWDEKNYDVVPFVVWTAINPPEVKP